MPDRGQPPHRRFHCGATGVDDFRAGVLPADKAEYVAALRREGHTVLMVGDGINDALALAEADVGIAWGPWALMWPSRVPTSPL